MLLHIFGHAASRIANGQSYIGDQVSHHCVPLYTFHPVQPCRFQWISPRLWAWHPGVYAEVHNDLLQLSLVRKYHRTFPHSSVFNLISSRMVRSRSSIKRLITSFNSRETKSPDESLLNVRSWAISFLLYDPPP